jgi:dihydrolipoamide dehydrogenase
MGRFDVLAIGAGPGGYSAALVAAGHGLSVAIVEKGEIGGACLNRGCVPAKAWISSAETVDMAEHMATLAAEPFKYAPDFKKAVAKQKAIVAQFRNSLTALLEKRGVKIIRGSARFVSPSTAVVDGADGAVEISFGKAVIATGTQPSNLFGAGPDPVLDSSSIFDMETLPSSIIIVGAGAIGCEFASALSRFGVKVTILELLPRILPVEDSEISSTLAREFKKRKIGLETGVRIVKLERAGDGATATLEDGRTVTADKALVSTGRRFPTDSLGLDTAGVKTGPRGEIVTDGLMRTSAPNIFAVGDVAGKYLLAYTAYAEGRHVADVIAGKTEEQISMIVPSAVFTIPEIGSVGVTEEKAPAGFKKGIFHFRSLARAHSAGEIAGLVKVIADGTTDKLLGVHIIGPRATDMIHIASVAMTAGMTARYFGRLIFGHPTFAEALMEAVHDVHGESIHK